MYVVLPIFWLYVRVVLPLGRVVVVVVEFPDLILVVREVPLFVVRTVWLIFIMHLQNDYVLARIDWTQFCMSCHPFQGMGLTGFQG